MDWLLLQLADSSFPTGGFAHSCGLEAALQHGEIPDVASFEIFLHEALWQAGNGGLLLAGAAHALESDLAGLDDLCELFLNNPVANRASRVQGRAFLSTVEKSFASDHLSALCERLRNQKSRQHHAPVFGAALRVLGVERSPMQRLYLHGALRGIVSAAVRLGIFGPYQAQQIQSRFGSVLDVILARCGDLSVDELAQTAPRFELLQSNHDRLYSRLFQS